MKSNIKRIRFSSLWKNELPELANSVIEIVEKHNPETLKIKVFFDLFVEQEPQIKLLDFRYGPHPITKKLNILRKRRKALAQGIPNRLMTIEKGGSTIAIEHLEVAQSVVNRYLTGLSRSNNKIISQEVTKFLEQCIENAALQTAIEALDMSSYIDDLKGVHIILGEQYGNRRASVSARPNAKTNTIVMSILTAMINLFKHIELAQVENQELDYTPLIDELNNELTSFGTLINARASYNKRKAEEVIIDGNSEEPSEPTESANKMLMRSMNVDEVQEDLQNDLDTKKAAAMPTRQTRLPDVSTEA